MDAPEIDEEEAEHQLEAPEIDLDYLKSLSQSDARLPFFNFQD